MPNGSTPVPCGKCGAEPGSLTITMTLELDKELKIWGLCEKDCHPELKGLLIKTAKEWLKKKVK